MIGIRRSFLTLAFAMWAFLPAFSQNVVLSPARVSFGNQIEGTTGSVHNVTLKNGQRTAITITSIATSLPDYATTNNCPVSPATLAPAASCTVSITFTPAALGTRTAILTVTDSGSSSPQTSTLNGVGTAPSLLSIAVAPTTASVIAGYTQQFTATGTYNNGTTQNLSGTAAWSSSKAAVATVNGSGLATSVAKGAATIKAKVGSVSGSASLTVTASVLTSISIAPNPASIGIGATQQFSATGIYSNGTTQNLTGTAKWSSSAATVATVASGGLATGVAQGSATISAKQGGITASATLTVGSPLLTSISVTPATPSIAAGTTQQFTATGTYTDGSTQNLTGTVNWSSSATTVATIAAGGLATGTAAGTASITATSGSVSGSATLTVGPPSLVSIAVTPASPSFALGTTQQFTATGTYTDGSTLNLTSTVTWSTANSAIATINSQGLATSAALGTTGVTATSGAISGSATLTVTAAVVVSIAVTPAVPTISLGTTQQFTATGTYTDGSTQAITDTVQWSSDAPTVATISNAAGAQGLATSVGPGTANVSATSGTVNGSTALTVTSAALVSIAITPATPSLALGTMQQFKATGTFSDGSTQNLTGTVTWTSDTPSSATINNSGLATMVGVGTATITATSGSIGGSTLLTVTPTTLVSIAISPPSATIPLGVTQQFTATGTFTDGTTQDVTQSGQWSSTVATVATISNTAGTNGLATTLGTGTTTIGISSGGVSASASLVVNPAALVSIAISPQAPAIALGATQQFTATGTYTDGSTQNVTSIVTWSSSLSAVAIIGNSAGSYGLATSSGQGTSTITAASGTVSSSTTITVGTASLVSIALSPANTYVPVGGSEQFTATGTYTDGSTQNLTSTASWSSSSSSATVNGGLAVGVSAGMTSITASSGSVSGSATLAVGPQGLPLGTVSGVTQITCPTEPFDSAWVSEVNNGPPVAICYSATVSCPNLPDLGLTYGVATPGGISNGTVVFVSPKGGETPVGGNLATNIPYEVYHANYQTVQMAWDTDWRDGAIGGGYFKSAACREATMLNYFNTTYYQAAVNSATAGSCAISYSGGASGLAYSLTYYGANYLDKATFVSGPHYGNLVEGCVPSSPPISICPSSDGVTYPMGCNTLSGTWTESGLYTGEAANQLGGQIGSEPPCDASWHAYTAQDELNLTADSLVDDAGDSNFTYPQTAVSAFECDDDQNWNNPSETQGWEYLSQISSPAQVAAGCNYANTLDQNACMVINRVYGCQTVEAAYSGYVCVGNTCPVCSGNPPSCTCGGSACSGNFADQAALLADFEDPVNGCIKRH
jgi:uncharacterized protein YjdB